MKKRIYLLPLLASICALLIGCTKPVTEFNQHGISFTCPSGWKIDEVSEIEDGCYYVCVEKSGLNSSGIVTIVTMDEGIDLEEWLSIFQGELMAQPIYAQLSIGNAVEGNYGQYETLCVHYTANVLSLPHEGRMHVFAANGKAVCITEQEAVEDKSKNAAGFETIRESLNVE